LADLEEISKSFEITFTTSEVMFLKDKRKNLQLNDLLIGNLDEILQALTGVDLKYSVLVH
jgi:hypothetical protein